MDCSREVLAIRDWLAQKGQLLHELYRDFMAGLVARGARADAGSSQQNDELAALREELAQHEAALGAARASEAAARRADPPQH